MPAQFVAFISYKHARSSAFAERLELALKAYAKPLWQPPPPIFRDEKYLRPGLDLPKMIRDALDASEFLVYLASPDAAASPWVEDELVHWCADPERRKKLIIVLTEGRVALESRTKVIDWNQTDALPPVLRGVLETVPYYLDCTALSAPERQTLLDPDFKKVVNAIVAAFRDVDPIEMIGKEIEQHRKNLRTRRLLVGAAIAATIVAAAGAALAVRQAREARAQARISRAAQLASEAEAAAAASLPQRALLLGVAAAEVTRAAGEEMTPQVEQTLRNLLAEIGGYGLSGHSGAVEQLAFFGNDSLLSIGSDGQVLLWHLDGDRPAKPPLELIAGKGRVVAVNRIRDEKVLRIVTDCGQVMLRALTPGYPLLASYALPGLPPGEPCAVAVRKSEVIHVSGAGELRTWDLRGNQPRQPAVRRIAADAGGGCTTSPGGAWLYVETNDGPPVVVSLEAPSVAIPLPADGAETIRVLFDPVRRQLVEALSDGRVRGWRLDAEGGRVRPAFSLRMRNGDNAVIGCSRSGRLLAVAGERGDVALWRIDGPAPRALGSVTVPLAFDTVMEGRLSFERGDTILVASDGYRAGAVIALSAHGAPERIQVLYSHPAADDVMGDRATPYAVHPTLPLLVAAGGDRTASVWSVGADGFRGRARPLRGHDGDILALAFSPDGRLLATAGHDRVIRLWPAAPPQWVAAPAFVSFEPEDLTLNDGPINPGGGVQVARFLVADAWFDAYGEAARIRFGRMGPRGRLERLVTPAADATLPGIDPREAAVLGLRSGVPALHRRRLADLHRRAGLPPPANDVPYDVDDDGHAIVEASERGARMWDLRRTADRPVDYLGFDAPVSAVRISVASGLLAAVSGAERLAVWRIGSPAAPLFVRDLAALRASARALDGRAPAEEEAWPDSPWIAFLAGGRWIYLTGFFASYLVRADPDAVAWKLPGGAHESQSLGGCCVMQVFKDRFDFWITGADAVEPLRLDPGASISGVTAYDYDAVRRRLAIGLLDGRVQLLQLDGKGSVSGTGNVATHDNLIRSVALSNAGDRVAAGSVTGITVTTIGADLAVRRHIRLQRHRGDVSLLRFSPGDQWLLTGGDDDKLHVHPARAGSLLGLACAVAGRTFSEVERSRLGDARLAAACR